MTEATETAVAEIVERLRQPIRCLSRTATEGSKEVEDFYALGDVILANEGDVHLANWTRDRAATALEQEHAARVKAEGERDGLVRRIRIFERANTEMHRAEVTAEQPRLQRAGDRYYLAKLRLFDRARALLQGEPS